MNDALAVELPPKQRFAFWICVKCFRCIARWKHLPSPVFVLNCLWNVTYHPTAASDNKRSRSQTNGDIVQKKGERDRRARFWSSGLLFLLSRSTFFFAIDTFSISPSSPVFCHTSLPTLTSAFKTPINAETSVIRLSEVKPVSCPSVFLPSMCLSATVFLLLPWCCLASLSSA